MKEIYQDSDLREALRRKYADTPELPADFMDGLMKRIQETESAPQPAKRRLWLYPAVAAAALVLLIVGVGETTLHTDKQGQNEKLVAENHAQLLPSHSTEELNAQQLPSHSTEELNAQQLPSHVEEGSGVGSVTLIPQAESNQEKRIETPPLTPPLEGRGVVSQPLEEGVDADPNLRYASDVATEDTALSEQDTALSEQDTALSEQDTALSEQDEVPYQDPARVDEFIAKLADYNHVKQGELTCTAPSDSTVVSCVYVFPDVKEVDVFGRLLQVACWYSDETPGYLLNFSHRQFFFELKDLRRQLHYRWIAERVNGKILLYSTCSPIEVVVSSACYMEYRDELMHTRSINNKTRDI